jgi:L-lactate permease
MHDWEEQINALLEGELDHDESDALKSAATGDQALAKAIIEAYQLQRAMEHVSVERAPASLRKSLRKIPRQHGPIILQPRWAMAFAIVPLLIISVFLLSFQQPATITTTPVNSETVKLEQARQDLAVAFAYIEQVSGVTSNRIETELGGEMSDAVAGSIFKTIQQQKLL